MTRRISRRVWGTGIVLGIVLIFLVGVIWWGTAASNKPQFQGQITMPSMAGTSDFLVNVWLDPHPAHVGTTQVTAQVTSTVGTATPLDSVDFKLLGPDGAALVSVNATRGSGPAPDESFSAPVSFNSAAEWQLTVEIHNGDITRTATFAIAVKQS